MKSKKITIQDIEMYKSLELEAVDILCRYGIKFMYKKPFNAIAKHFFSLMTKEQIAENHELLSVIKSDHSQQFFPTVKLSNVWLKLNCVL